MSKTNPFKPITEIEWQSVQDNAKHRALAAVKSGDSQRLTALERGYYNKFMKIASPNNAPNP